ncbi:hypothetical protein [Dokdonella sp.]|uniref:hypothetical protein n=1 Tax=Dokdonella sp. TaxID=2291710 RepID=UPI0031C21B20|nr:hypothetical protein [Dokdonella sp.]
MTTKTSRPLGGILLLVLFAAPLLIAMLLTSIEWRPEGTRNYGELIEPPQDLNGARFVLEDGRTLAWRDAAWSWTLFALPGPDCAAGCMARLDELRRVRISMDQNQQRVRVIVLDPALAPRLAPLAPVQAADDAEATLAALRPAGADQVAVAIADPHGFLVLRYPVGYDANRLRKDLARVIKG